MDDSVLNWAEVWILSRDPDFMVQLSATRGDLDLSLTSSKIGLTSLPDVWRWASTGVPVDRKSRSGYVQFEILKQYLQDFILFTTREDAQMRMSDAIANTRRLFVWRTSN